MMTVGMPKDIPIAIAIRSLVLMWPRAGGTVGVAVAVAIAVKVAVAVAVAADLRVKSVEAEKSIKDVEVV